MPQKDLTDEEAARAFAVQLDEISRRTRVRGTGDMDPLRAILDEHEAACVAMDDAEARRTRDTDRVPLS